MNSQAEDKLLRMLAEGKITPEQFKELRANAELPREIPATENPPAQPTQSKDEGSPTTAPVRRNFGLPLKVAIVGFVIVGLVIAGIANSRARHQRDVAKVIVWGGELKIRNVQFKKLTESANGSIVLTGPVAIRTDNYFFSAARWAELRPAERKLLLRGNASAGGGIDSLEQNLTDIETIEIDFSNPKHIEILQVV